MAKFASAQILFAGLICCSIAQGTSARSTSKMLAVTVSGIDCAAAASRPSKLSAAAQLGSTSATTCTLYACQAPSKDSACHFHSIPQLTFFPCEQGAVLISTRYILQHLQAAGDSEDSQYATTNTAGLSEATVGNFPADSKLSDAFGLSADSSSTLQTVSLLQLSVACRPAPVHGSQEESRFLAARTGTFSRSDTFTLTLSPEDLTTYTEQPSSSSNLAAGSSSHNQPYIELQATAGPEAMSAHLKDGWSAGNLEQQLVLVDLVLPEAPKPTSEQHHASTPEQQPNTTADDTIEQLMPDSADVAAPTCSAGWQLWLTRACMVVFVGGLQLLPLSSALLKAR
jgi:hypothetical protein